MIDSDQWKDRIPTIPEGVVLFTILPSEGGFWFPATCMEVTVGNQIYGCKHITSSPKHILEAMIPLDRQAVYAVTRQMAKELGEQCPELNTLCVDVKEWTLPKTATLMRAKYQF
uniref:Minor tail protein n=1 Tax=Gordonia phage Petito TaxID=3158876 RepID=A0AAU8GPQ1_9CAUD